MPELPKIVRERLQAAGGAGAHPDADLLTAFAERSLAGRERERVLAHLAVCSECRQVVALAQPAMEEEAPAPVEGRRGWASWYRLTWVALAACLLVAAGVLYRPLLKAPERSAAVRQPVTEGYQAPAATDQAAKNAPAATAPPALAKAAPVAPAANERAEARAYKKEEAKDKTVALADKVREGEAGKPAEPPAAASGYASGGATTRVTAEAREPAKQPVGEVATADQVTSLPTMGRNSYDFNDADKRKAAAESTPAARSAAKSKGQPSGVGAGVGGGVGGGSAGGVAGGTFAAVPAPAPPVAQRGVVPAAPGEPGRSDMGAGERDRKASAAPSTVATGHAAMTQSSAATQTAAQSTAEVAAETQSPTQESAAQEKQQISALKEEPGHFAMRVVPPEWSVSEDGNVQVSVDGGNSWALRRPAKNVVFRAVSAVGALVWAGGARGNSGVLYHSEDFGRTWNEQLTFRPPTKGAHVEVTSVTFTDALHGTLVIGGSGLPHPQTWFTADGGTTWTPQLVGR